MKKTAAVDLDGTLAPHPTPDQWDSAPHPTDVFCDPFPGAKEFLEELSQDFDIIIHTCRCMEGICGSAKGHLLANKVRAWLEKHELPYDHIWIEPGKPVADVYIDDRAVKCRPQPKYAEFEFAEALGMARRLAKARPVEDRFRK